MNATKWRAQQGSRQQLWPAWMRQSLLLLLLLDVSRPAAAEVVPQELYDCLNEGQGLQKTVYTQFVEGFPTRLRLHRAWWSGKPRQVPLTIVTGLTPTRLSQLEAQCLSWKGPLSAAVYLVLHDGNAEQLSPPSQESLQYATNHVQELFDEMEGKDGCQLDVMLLYETVEDEVMKHLLPINTMRNYALLQARTPLVAMVDADLLVSAGLYKWLLDEGNARALRKDCAARSLFVLPAFETPHNPNMSEAHAVAAAAITKDKKDLGSMVQQRLVHQFAFYLFKRGHNATNYNKWFSCKEPYHVDWTAGYEPWFIIDRFVNPWYDSVFRGYGWNKVTQVHNTAHSNIKFKAHCEGFIVHRQHSRSQADQMYQSQKKSYEKAVMRDPTQADKHKTLAGVTHKFRNNVMRDVGAGTYTPVIDEGVKNCLAKLPWWSKAARGENAP